jgi:hypothetical protein
MQSSNTTTAAADSRSDRPMQRRATHTATQQRSNTAIQQRTLTTSTLSLINQRASHTAIQSHNAADTHTTTLHPQHARRHGSNTQRRCVQRSHSAPTTLAAPCRSRCRLLHYSGGTLRLRHARSEGLCRTSPQHGCATAAAADNKRATPLSHHEAMECMRTRNGTHRHARSNLTNDKQRCAVDGESAVQHRKPNRNTLSQRCVRITAESHARATRTQYIVSVHGVITMHDTTADLRNTQAFPSLRADVTRSAQNSCQVSRMTAISTCSTISRLNITFVMCLKQNVR